MSKGESTRQAILGTAAAVASRVGLEGLTIGSLAEASGMSKSGLFAHFQSKEALQAQVLEHVGARFTELVIRPALKARRGEPRLRALFDRVLMWPPREEFPGGCPLMAAVSELDDRPGSAREVLVRLQRDWLDTIATVARTAVAEGHFRKDVDPDQIAFEMLGAELGYHFAHRLLKDPRAQGRARAAFEAIVERSKKR
jgi:AcrR family transcriptional regulator